MYICTLSLYIYMYIHMYIYTHIYIHTYICAFMYMYDVHIGLSTHKLYYIYFCKYICVYIHIYEAATLEPRGSRQNPTQGAAPFGGLLLVCGAHLADRAAGEGPSVLEVAESTRGCPNR